MAPAWAALPHRDDNTWESEAACRRIRVSMSLMRCRKIVYTMQKGTKEPQVMDPTMNVRRHLYKLCTAWDGHWRRNTVFYDKLTSIVLCNCPTGTLSWKLIEWFQQKAYPCTITISMDIVAGLGFFHREHIPMQKNNGRSTRPHMGAYTIIWSKQSYLKEYTTTANPSLGGLPRHWY